MGAMSSGAVTVMGAGLLGSCVALDLAQHGIKVVLVEQDTSPMNRTSIRGEGKIHLGLVYANDPTLATARVMMDGALSFHRLLREWLGEKAGRIPVSTPFTYAVAHDSIMTPAELTSFYGELEELYWEQFRQDSAADYMGTRPTHLTRRLSQAELSRYLSPAGCAAAFQTAELAVRPSIIGQVVREAIAAEENITLLTGTQVQSVARRAEGFAIEVSRHGVTEELRSEQVVNCTWERRMVIDQSMGIDHGGGWLHRLKYGVYAKIPDALRGGPSITMVIGRYGDVVIHEDGHAYLSWYPVGLRGWTSDVEPPRAWDAHAKGAPPVQEAAEVVAQTLAAIDRWYPGIGASQVISAGAGAIVAKGHTDVNDKASRLHDRAMVDIKSLDGYHTIYQGKLTTSPYFARLAAQRILGVEAAV